MLHIHRNSYILLNCADVRHVWSRTYLVPGPKIASGKSPLSCGGKKSYGWYGKMRLLKLSLSYCFKPATLWQSLLIESQSVCAPLCFINTCKAPLVSFDRVLEYFSFCFYSARRLPFLPIPSAPARYSLEHEVVLDYLNHPPLKTVIKQVVAPASCEGNIDMKQQNFFLVLHCAAISPPRPAFVSCYCHLKLAAWYTQTVSRLTLLAASALDVTIFHDSVASWTSLDSFLVQ